MEKKEKFVFIIVFFITLFIVGFSIKFTIDSNSLKKYRSDILSFRYDRTWSVSKFEDNIYLVDSNGNNIVINTTLLTDDMVNMSVEDINSSVISKLMSDNSTYAKIAEEDGKFTSIYYDGYKTLLESDDSQALVFVVVTSDYIVTVNYTAKNKYFDLELDSVENIVGSIAI